MADQYRPEAGAPVTAEDAEHRGFTTSFRGFDPAEVRAYLRRVAETMRALHDEQRRLETRAREAERRAENPTLDEATLAAALGDETARILRSAHEAAAEIRGKAEAHVEAIAQQARDEGARLTAEAANILEVRRHAAEAEAEQIVRAAAEEADRLRQDARAEADEMLAAAVGRAEEAVEDARHQRAGVLSDLRRRRRVANTQIEQLRAGRERLLAAYEVVGRTLAEVSDELQRADAEARAAADDVGRRLSAAVDPDAVDALGSSTFAPLEVPVGPASPAPQAERPPTEPSSAEPSPEDPSAVDVADVEPAPTEIAMAAPPVVEAPPTVVITSTPRQSPPPQGRPHRRKGKGGRPPAPPISDAGPAASTTAPAPRDPSPEPTPAEAAPTRAAATIVDAEPAATLVDAEPAATLVDAEPAAEASGADELFARLRAEREAAVAAAEDVLSDEPTESPETPGAATADRTQFEARDAACEPLEAHLSRRIKRALQDEQNLALDRLRSTRGTASVDVALGEEAAHRAVYTAIVQPALTDAAAAGASASGADPLAAAPAVDAVAADLAAEIVVPLRRRLDERLHEAAAVGDDRATITDRVGAAYRELKAQRVSGLAAHWLAIAWATGAYSTAPGRPASRWAVDPERQCCTDCDDNALAGALPPGDAFPTGHQHPPAHPGCRCVLVPATT